MNSMTSLLRRARDAARSRWSCATRAWENANTSAPHRLKTAAAEHEAAAQGASPVTRARLDAVEREKLDLYQRRYAEYVRTAKALQALIGP